LILGLIGGLIGCGAFVVVLAATLGLLFNKQQSDATAAQIVSGSADGLEGWTSQTLAEVSRNSVGSWHFYRPMGGRRVFRMTAGMHSCCTRGELARFSAEKRSKGGEITVLTHWTRLDISFTPSDCRIWVNQSEFGVLGLTTGRISDPHGAELGAYQRGSDGGRLFLRGRDLARVRHATEPESALPTVPEPFCAWLAPALDEEATLWLLAVMAIEAGYFAMPGASAPW
jgi:hypothetical protein